MKQLSGFLLIILIFSAVLVSCGNNDPTYAQQLKTEQELIADYIKRNNIKIVTVKPSTFPWGDNVYYLTTTGLYIHLVSEGDKSNLADTLLKNDLVIPRFYQYTLNAKADTISNWNTIDYPFPTTFNYLENSQVCVGWHEAVSYMKRNNSRAKFILFSKIGFPATGNEVTPYGYDMIIKIQK